jgi:predicted nucleic acid-binding protein
VILDTNALSAWADGKAAIKPSLSSASKLVVPAVVLGEFDFGIRQSRHYRRYIDWLEKSLRNTEIAVVDEKTAKLYGDIRLALKKAGTPIPVNDAWIAASALQFDLPILSRDAHFDSVDGVSRIAWEGSSRH